jgi:MFS family permease
MFSNSMSELLSVVLPLWLASMGTSPWVIGLVIGAKHVLPLLFAIHGGALIDRLGARRVMLICALTSIAILPQFPLEPWISAIIFLQMVNGFASTMCWMGAQASFGRALSGHPDFAGPFSFTLRLGSFMGPPLAGIGWDLAGVWGGFGVLMLWAAGMLAGAMALPQDDLSAHKEPPKIAELLPRVSDYRAALALALVPAMSIVLIVSLFRICAASIQDSFYAYYLYSIGMTGTLIGSLITISSAFAAMSTLWVGRLSRMFDPLWVLIYASMASVAFIACTPLLTSYFALAVLAILRGIGMGISQPLMLSLVATSSERSQQGMSVALRTTANRMAAAVTPPTMGIMASMLGLAASFLLMGTVVMTGLIMVAMHVARKEREQREAELEDW